MMVYKHCAGDDAIKWQSKERPNCVCGR